MLPHDVRVQSRVLRKSYGAVYSIPFKKRIHREEDKFWDEPEQIDRAENQMEWMGTAVSSCKQAFSVCLVDETHQTPRAKACKLTCQSRSG